MQGCVLVFLLPPESQLFVCFLYFLYFFGSSKRNELTKLFALRFVFLPHEKLLPLTGNNELFKPEDVSLDA